MERNTKSRLPTAGTEKRQPDMRAIVLKNVPAWFEVKQPHQLIPQTEPTFWASPA